MAKLSPSQLPGTHRTRVFVGGGYAKASRAFLDGLSEVIQESGYVPIVADEFALPKPERDIHDVTLWLLHSCRVAVFEASEHSGALMEIERLMDYGIHKALFLYHHPRGKVWPDDPAAWEVSQMLRSLALEQDERFVVSVYIRPQDAFRQARRFLTAIRRSLYGKLHRI